jgi:hypothetical protein
LSSVPVAWGQRLLGHVSGVGPASGDHQQRHVDQFELVGGVEGHQIEQAAHRVLEGRARARVRAPEVLITLPVQVERQRSDLLIVRLASPA